MKKIIAILLVLAVCASLCACGGGDITTPTKPVQAPVPMQRDEAHQGGADTATESPEAVDPTGEAYPWEVEFNGEDYVNFEFEAPNGDKIVTWREGSIFGTERRNLYEWAETGDIEDSYYYPSGNTSHSYMYKPDGTYIEQHFLDNGHTDLEKMMTYNGTMVYYKQINPDGTWSETHCDENGKVTYSASLDAEGTYWEGQTSEDGTRRDIFDNSATGYHSESEYYANGNIKKSVSDDSEAGMHYESEYYENGNLKYSKNQSPEYTTEECYDEEGFRTYFYSKNEGWEIELTANETGKLVKIVDNGVVKEDAATLAQYARDYNFKE